MLTSFGKLELKKGHVLLKGTSQFGISQRVQELFCLVGQSVVYQEGCELLESLMGLQVSAPQLQRVCQHYGSVIDSLVKANCQSVIPGVEKSNNTDHLYVMMDGSMVYTREEKWKELKLGRLFYDSQVLDIQEKRREVRGSVYVSHLGSVDEFFPKFERHLVGYENKVIIGDGARWIWNWAEDNYPGALQILDFYHAKEKLVIFARYQFKEEQTRLDWIKKQLDLLLNDEVETVLSNLKACRARNPEAKVAKQKVMDYYMEHEDRMFYKSYRDKGLMIGSGPIEAAHRSVIQQRLKLSGQKWSIKGAQAVANLRCYKQSGAWGMVRKIVAAAA